MDISKIIYVLRAIGIGGIARTIHYGLLRDVIEKRFPISLNPNIFDPGVLKQFNPINGGLVVEFEQARVEIIFLSKDLIRISWEPGKPPISYTIEKTDWDIQQPIIESNINGLSLVCDNLSLTINNVGQIIYLDADRNNLRLDKPPVRVGDGWSLSTILKPNEHIYGLGERAGMFNLRPGNYCSWNTDVQGNYSKGKDPLYIGTPIYLSLSTAGSYLVYYENSYRSTFNISDILKATFEGGMLRYYIFFGSLEDIYRRLSDLVGRPNMPPRWVFGYHQSRWGYRNEADIRKVVSGFEEHNLPLSAIHLDIDYMNGYRVFTIDSTRYPDMKQLTTDLEEKGIKVVASINPAVKSDPDYKVYSEGLSKDVYCKRPNGKIQGGVSWPGWSVFPDFSKSQARIWWQNQYQLLLKEGIAGIWHDMNEPSSFTAWGDKTLPISTQHDMEGQGGNHLEAHNIYGLLMNQAGYEAIRKYLPDKRPWIFTRAGWASLQRYAWNWTGDTETSWESLQQTISTILGLGLSGHAFAGVDIGGFSGSPSAELYLRWFQMATFLPLFRTHSAIGTKPREPWVYGEPTTSIVRKFLLLRYKLLHYLYSLAWDTAHSGIPPIRPLFWDDPDDLSLWDIGDEFLLGNELLIAPIVSEGKNTRQINLPHGRWYSFWDDKLYVGPKEFEVEANLEVIPIFIKAGAILPLEDDGNICLHVYPDINNTSSSHVYFDAGDGYGPWRLDDFHLSYKQNTMEILWRKEGDFPFPFSFVSIQIHDKSIISATIDGENCPIQNNGFTTPVFQKLILWFR
jgi:alpha-glucosidase